MTSFRAMTERSIGNKWHLAFHDRTYKLAGYDFADSLGVPRPAVIYTGDIHSIPWRDLPNRFVIHPVRGCSAIGVIPLQRVSSVAYQFTGFRHNGKPYTASQIERLFLAEQSEHGVWIESYVDGLREVQAYMFGEHCPLYCQLDRLNQRYCCYDGDFKPVWGVFKNHVFAEAELSPVAWPHVLRSTAAKLSRACGSAFVRVDLFDTPIGVVFNEITAHPGHYKQFTREWDQRLGELWAAGIKENAQ